LRVHFLPQQQQHLHLYYHIAFAPSPPHSCRTPEGGPPSPTLPLSWAINSPPTRLVHLAAAAVATMLLHITQRRQLDPRIRSSLHPIAVRPPGRCNIMVAAAKLAVILMIIPIQHKSICID
jgi:hypothetical protein